MDLNESKVLASGAQRDPTATDMKGTEGTETTELFSQRGIFRNLYKRTPKKIYSSVGESYDNPSNNIKRESTVRTDTSNSIFSESRKETFLESLQESMLVHAALRDRAEKLASHMGISIGEATNQLKAHLVEQSAKKKKGNPYDPNLGMRAYDKGQDDLVPNRSKAERVQRVMSNVEKGNPKLPKSTNEAYKEFISEYEALLSEKGISEYDLDEATEYFIEEILPVKRKEIISEGVDLLITEKLDVDSFIEWLEESLGVLKQAGKDMMKNDLPNAIKTHAEAAKKLGDNHPLVKKLKAHVDHVVQTAADHQINMKAA